MAGRRPARGSVESLVMLCDVDFSFPDATRTHTVEVARGFARHGLSVELIARGPDPELPGVRFHPAQGRERQRLKRLLTINTQAVAALWRNRRRGDRFYVRDSWSCFPALLAARAFGYRCVIQVDGIPYGPSAEVVDQAMLLLGIKRAVAVLTGRLVSGALAVTPEIRQLLIEIARVPPRKIRVIGNGVDLNFFRPGDRAAALARLGLGPDQRYVVFCGGFNPWSDFDTILQAFARVRAEQPDVRLVLVGDGPERDRIEQLSEQLGIGEFVEITGMIPDRERVRDYLWAATVTLLAYRSDQVNATSASPIKLMEYLACARAVLAVELPDIAEFVADPGAGLVVRGDTEAFAAGLREILSGEPDAMGARGRKMAERRLSWDSVISRTLPLFDSAQLEGLPRDRPSQSGADDVAPT